MNFYFPFHTFQTRYRSGDSSALPRKFYNEVLPCTKLYKRAVGFFSSSSFLEISYGILGLVQNGGKMRLITSPRLNADDVEAIKKGYESRNGIYIKAFKREMTVPKTINEQNRLNILANLIEQGILEIKIAVTENPEVSMYHEKIGIFKDDDGNKIAISGSMNESETAISANFVSSFLRLERGRQGKGRNMRGRFRCDVGQRARLSACLQFSRTPRNVCPDLQT